MAVVEFTVSQCKLKLLYSDTVVKQAHQCMLYIFL